MGQQVVPSARHGFSGNIPNDFSLVQLIRLAELYA
jgi:hypothetical protein